MFNKNRSLLITRMALVLVLIAGVFGVRSAQADSVGFGWANDLGSGFGGDVQIDELGNVYNTGSLNGDMFISKHDNNGNLIWLKSTSGSSGVGLSLAVDGDGNVISTGRFQGTVDFDPGPGTYNLSSSGAGDIFIAKLDTNGDFVWAKKFGGTEVDEAYKVAVDGNGNVYTTGTFFGTVDFDPGVGTYNLTSAGPGNDIFICKLGANGNFLWAKSIEVTFGGGGIGMSIALDESGNIYATGVFTGVADFDPGVGEYILNSTSDDGYVSKFDNDGNFIWARNISDLGGDMGIEIALDNNDNVYAVGGIDSAFIIKLNVNGDFEWLGTLNGASAGYGIATDGNGNVLTTGSFAGTIDFDPGVGTSNLTSVGDYDIFIGKLGTSGNFVWAKNIGGSDYDSGESIAIDDGGNIYLTGEFGDTVDFDPGDGVYNLITTNPNGEVFVTKLSSVSHIIYVNQDSTGASDGSSWTDAYTDLQSALSAASSGDEIWVAAGTYKPTAGTDRTISFELKNGVAVYGGFVGMETLLSERDPKTNVTTLSGDIGVGDSVSDNSYHVVVGSNTDSSAILDGFTITAGYANGIDTNASGGGMYNNNGNPSVMNLIFSGNSAFEGGGGMSNEPYGNPALTDVTFSNNSAGWGGGMSNEFYSSPTLTNVTFNNNLADLAGGMLNSNNSSPILVNVTFTENIANEGGGGMLNRSNTDNPTLTNVTFYNNSAPIGGGIDNAGNPIIINSIIWGNTGEELINHGLGIPVIIHSVIEGGCPAGTTCNSIITTDPLLGTLGNYGGITETIPLQSGSSAIDAGDDGVCPATDQRGVTRPQGSHCDIGAFEYAVVTPTFDDVPFSHPYYEYIEILYANGLTNGCSLTPRLYCPDMIMNRAQVAKFFMTVEYGGSYLPPVDTKLVFKDSWKVNPWAKLWANDMYAKGLTNGCKPSPLLYCPDKDVIREQVAKFGLAIKYGNDYEPPPATGMVFADLTDVNYWATAWAEQAYAEGLVPACGMAGGKPKFCPYGKVDRGFAAFVIVTATGLLDP